MFASQVDEGGRPWPDLATGNGCEDLHARPPAHFLASHPLGGLKLSMAPSSSPSLHRWQFWRNALKLPKHRTIWTPSRMVTSCLLWQFQHEFALGSLLCGAEKSVNVDWLTASPLGIADSPRPARSPGYYPSGKLGCRAESHRTDRPASALRASSFLAQSAPR
jgi:hypothetical protein